VFEFWINGPSSNLDFNGERVYTTQTGPNTKLLPLLKKDLSTIRIAGYNKALNTKNDPCSEDLPRADCWLGCRAAYIGKNCGCWPLSGFGLPNRPDNMPLCGTTNNGTANNSAEYVNIPIVADPDGCGQIANMSDPDKDCKDACLQNCEYALLGIENKPFEGYPPSFQNKSYIRLTVQYFQYPFFEQSLAMSDTDYFNQLGGALGLYIGCSFIAMFHIIIFPTHMIMDCVAKRRKKKIINNSFNNWLSAPPNPAVDHKIGNGDSKNSLPGYGAFGPPAYGRDNPTVITVDDEI
jgi:hypothetical protein